jgi:homoserine O-acetyltransferase
MEFANRYPDLNSFIRERWEGGYVNNWDANDMIALLNTWQEGDISIVRDGGDYEKALKSIKAKGLIMPSKTDLYFPVSPPQSSCESNTDIIKAGGQRNGSVAPQRR